MILLGAVVQFSVSQSTASLNKELKNTVYFVNKAGDFMRPCKIRGVIRIL